MGVFDWFGDAAEAVGGAIGDVVGGVGDFVSGDTAQNRFKEPGFQSEYENTMGYGMRAMGDNNAMGGWASQQMMGNRGPQAVEDARLAGMAGGNPYQSQALGFQAAAANGLGTSAAMSQMRQGFNEAAAQQAAQAGGARGAAGIALASANAGANVSNLNQQAATQAAQLRANEMNQARMGLGQMSGQARGQDLDRNAQYNQNQQFNAQLNDQYKLGMGNVANAYGQTGMGYYNAANQGMASRESTRLDAYNAQQNRAAGINQANADARSRAGDRVWNTGVSLVQTAAQK